MVCWLGLGKLSASHHLADKSWLSGLEPPQDHALTGACRQSHRNSIGSPIGCHHDTEPPQCSRDQRIHNRSRTTRAKGSKRV